MPNTNRVADAHAKPNALVTVARCHDVVVSLDGKHVAEFDHLVVMGMAVRLSLHLRGCAAVPYDLLRQIALHYLKIPPHSLRPVIELLAEVEFVRIDKEGSTIRSIIPTVPYYEDLFGGLSTMAQASNFSEPEWLTLTLVNRLAAGPMHRAHVHSLGAEKKLTDRMLSVAADGGYLTERRARGRDILLSPLYFPEHSDVLADTAATFGPGRVSDLLTLLTSCQGIPLKVAGDNMRIGEVELSPEDLQVIISLAGDGVCPAPSIKTTHHGENTFIFAPMPGIPRVTPTKRHIYEAAMALVAAVRQGQYLPARFAIRSPRALLAALRDRGYVKASTEAQEQYRALVVMRLGRLESRGGGWHRFALIDTPENKEAVGLAIQLIEGSTVGPSVDDDVVLAISKGQDYVDSIVNRQVVAAASVDIHPDIVSEIDTFLLKEAE